MRWKLLLAVLVIVILGMLLTTQHGLNLADFIKNKISETSSFIFGVQPKSAFPAILTVGLNNKNSFYGQSYKLSDSTFTTSSMFNSIKIDDGKISVPEKRTDMIIRGFRGNFEITSFGSLKLTGESTYIKINMIEMTREKPYKVEVEALPFDCSPSCSFQLEGLSSNIVFPSVTGEVKKLKADGSLDQLKRLENERLEIENFNGIFQLSDDSLILTGMTSQIRGEGFVFK
ncbi:MAG: hypothetical protein QMD12_02645 [Candidatus Aenigmarchaeota archaeon]|nr:hypothetical protein [Candidatus Aenigmarchaeota archaeon]